MSIFICKIRVGFSLSVFVHPYNWRDEVKNICIHDENVLNLKKKVCWKYKTKNKFKAFICNITVMPRTQVIAANRRNISQIKWQTSHIFYLYLTAMAWVLDGTIKSIPITRKKYWNQNHVFNKRIQYGA